MGPPIPGFGTLNACAYAFLITHTDLDTGKSRKVIFDLGAPRDWENDLSPKIVERLKSWNIELVVKKYVSEILEEQNVPIDSIEAVIWSHPHWDHIGRPSLFHPSTTLVVGPDVYSTYGAGFPENPDAPMFGREFEGREIKEISFNGPGVLEIGGLRALDYFGDGSFYLLDAPGHAIGHMNGLVRTTLSSGDSSSTFLYLGADSFHRGCQLRPNAYPPLPSSLALPGFNPCQCAGELFHTIHPTVTKSTTMLMPLGADPNTSPFQTVSVRPDGTTVAVDIHTTRDVIDKIQALDADENIFVVAAHDLSLYDVIDYFPRKANKWKEKGWKEEARWRFLGDLDAALEIAKAAGERKET